LPSALIALSIKEIKEMLRDRRILLGMIVVPLLMFPLMGGAISTSVRSVEESTKNVNLAVVNLDEGSGATEFIAFLRSHPGVHVNMSRSVEEAIGPESKVTVSIVIPNGFSANLTHGKVGNLELHTLLRSLDLSESATSSRVGSLVTAYGKNLLLENIRKEMPTRDPASLLNPVSLSYTTQIKDRSVNINPQTLGQVITAQSIMIPIIIMILLIFAMQIAATSMAMEKEEKTIETIITLPVSRLSILASKLAGSVFVSAVAAGAYMIGFTSYVGSIMNFGGTGLNIDLASLGLAYTPTALLLFGISLFMSLVAGLALAVSISVFSEDVRGAQSLVGVLTIPIILPAIILIVSDIKSLPLTLQILLYAIPFSHPIIAAKAALLGDYLTIILGIGYTGIFTLGVLYIAARIFTTEKIVTAKLATKMLRLRR